MSSKTAEKPDMERPFLRFGVLLKGRLIARAEKRGEAATIANRHSMAKVIDLEEEAGGEQRS